MFFGELHKKDKIEKKRDILRKMTDKTYPQFWGRKSGENVLIHGFVNFIHNFGDKNTEFVNNKKNVCFVIL